MPRLDPNDPIFAGLPTSFDSPFPSEEAQASRKFQALERDAPSYLCRLQAQSWQDVTHLTMRELGTSALTGGFRQQVLRSLVYTAPEGIGGAEVLRGLFARAAFPDDVSPARMFDAAVEVGLQAAIDVALSAVPVVGQALGAAVALGKWMAQLARASEEEIKKYAPWVEYKRDTDTDMVNAFLIGRIAGSVDWTSVWEPPFDVSGGFSIMETTQPGENRSYAAWGVGELAEPRYVAGALGAMPGMQRIAERIQIARLYGKVGQEQRDAVTHCGSYFPATSQWATVAWGMVNDAGSPDAFKIQPAMLNELWHAYFRTFFEDGFAQVKYHADRSQPGDAHWYSALCMAKALCASVITPQGYFGMGQNFIANAGNLQSFVGPDLLDPDGYNRVMRGQVFRCPYPAIIKPALRKQKLRQLRTLARTPVCAYVRPRDLPNLPAFAAFKDPGPPEDPAFDTWGEELIAFCEYVRGELLKHPIRYAVRTEDVRAVDPVFAELLADSKGIVPELGIKANGEPLAETPDPPDAEPPKGGAPFEAIPAKRAPSPGRTAAIVLGGTAAAAAAGVGGYFLWRHFR